MCCQLALKGEKKRVGRNGPGLLWKRTAILHTRDAYDRLFADRVVAIVIASFFPKSQAPSLYLSGDLL
jgi:hypothetical protein